MKKTDPHMKVLAAIEQFVAAKGISPTLRELAKATYKGLTTISASVDELERRGLLRRTRVDGVRIGRNISLIPQESAA